MLISESQSVTLDPNGSGVIRIAFPGKNAVIRSVTLATQPATRETLGRIYRDFVGPPYLVDTTYTAGSGDTSDTVHQVPDGHCLFVEWTGGDPGATATVTYTGMRD